MPGELERLRPRRSGLAPTQLIADLPELEPDDILQALAYADALAQDELHSIRA